MHLCGYGVTYRETCRGLPLTYPFLTSSCLLHHLRFCNLDDLHLGLSPLQKYPQRPIQERAEPHVSVLLEVCDWRRSDYVASQLHDRWIALAGVELGYAGFVHISQCLCIGTRDNKGTQQSFIVHRVVNVFSSFGGFLSSVY